jgi:hypothetical protein
MKIARLHPGSQGKRIAFAGLGILALVIAAFVVLPHGSPSAKPAKIVIADVSGRPTACLAADTISTGKSPVFERIWAAMHVGAAGRSINLQQLVLPVTSPHRAQPYLAGLLTQHCNVIVTIGPDFGQAIPAQLKAFPTSHFTAVDPGLTTSYARVTQVAAEQAPMTVQLEVNTLSAGAR